MARLSEGFLAGARGLTVVSESDLYGQRKVWRSRPGAGPRATASPERPAHHRLDGTGAGRPGGARRPRHRQVPRACYEIEFEGRLQEVLAIEYADSARLYVPVSQAHLLSRYVGVGRPARPRLHQLGGRRWSREKAAAEKAVRDLAARLLRDPGRRASLRAGYAFPADTPWQHEFEAAFPYEETAGPGPRPSRRSRRTWRRPRPMDRLVCGDVGYGKTEVAMRAAFKAVMDGKQVAVLVPTTVLAQQHFDTFATRMAAFPVAVEMLSRFRDAGPSSSRSLAALRDGRGRHRHRHPPPAPAGRRGSRTSGLVIIDEEQRFGVAQKERLKQLRQLVDVLTLTATPIPRTLYMSLLGARDMSTIQTAAAGAAARSRRSSVQSSDEVDPRGHPARAEPGGTGLLPAQPRA